MTDGEWFEATVQRAVGPSGKTKQIARKLSETIAFVKLDDKMLKGNSCIYIQPARPLRPHKESVL